jgi:nicotinamide mononucleotide (NMN) deamidase PncC
METMERAERVARLLVERGWRISVAESTAGGLILAAVPKVPGTSRYFERGVVAYSRAAKLDTLCGVRLHDMAGCSMPLPHANTRCSTYRRSVVSASTW